MKLKKSIITLLILFVSIFIIGNVECYAVTGSFSLNKSSVSLKKGKSTTVTLTVKNCEGTFTATSSDTSIATVSISDNDSDGDGWITSTAGIKIKAKKAGTATITISTSDVSDTSENEVTGSKTIKVTVTDSTSGSSNSSDKDNDKETNKLSTDATLKNLGITPAKYDFSGFKKATTSYSVTVPNEAEKITIYADADHSKATVTGTGLKKLEIGENTFKVKVTAEDKKTTKTYTLKITRKKEAEISTDATLKNLGITPAEYDFSGFRKMTTSYSVKVPYEAEKIKIYADSTSDKATIEGIGSKTLDVGLNTFTVKVTAEDKKTTKTYTLKITREEEKEEEPIEDEEPIEQENENISVVGLTNLQIEGLELTPEFSNDVYEYKVIVPSDKKVLDIKTERSSDDIIIDIVGNTNLQKGENVITLLVYNSKKDETTTYQIIANLEDNIDLTDVNNSISSAKRAELAKKSIIIGAIIIIAMLIIVFIVKRNKILSRNEFLENNDKHDRIDLSNDESMFERINENTEVVKKRTKKSKGKRFK